jgi:hypothetical protein
MSTKQMVRINKAKIITSQIFSLLHKLHGINAYCENEVHMPITSLKDYNWSDFLLGICTESCSANFLYGKYEVLMAGTIIVIFSETCCHAVWHKFTSVVKKSAAIIFTMS